MSNFLSTDAASAFSRFNNSTIKHVPDAIGHDIAQGGVFLLALVGEDVLLAQIFDFNNCV